jgi:hypothetical protein
LNISGGFSKVPKSIFMKFRPPGRKMFNTGGQAYIWTDKMTTKFVDHSFVPNLKNG